MWSVPSSSLCVGGRAYVHLSGYIVVDLVVDIMFVGLFHELILCGM